MDIVVRVKEIKGKCPVYRKGDKFILKDGYKLVCRKPVCMHALASLMPYYNVLRIKKGGEVSLNKDKEDEKAYLQCLDPGRKYTGGGTVIFEVYKK